MAPLTRPGKSHRFLGRGVALFWRLDGQAEEGWEQGRVCLPVQRPDKHWGPARDRAAAKASELASVPGARPGDAVAGGIACLGGFHAVERNGVGGRHCAPRLGAVPPRLWSSAARWGSAKAGCRAERRGVESSEKPASQAPRGLAKCRELTRWLVTPSGRSL